MQKVLRAIKNNTKLMGIVVTATAVGGLASGVAVASIPDSNGVIHSCYAPGLLGIGTFKIIDSSSQSCSGGETALNWNQQGAKGDKGDKGDTGNTGAQGPKGDTGDAGPAGATGAQGPAGPSGGAMVYDADGQALGTLLSFNDVNLTGRLTVYNSTLDRIVDLIPVNTDNSPHYVPGETTNLLPYFESNNCTGQSYLNGARSVEGIDLGTKLKLIRIKENSYGVVTSLASPQTITPSSYMSYNPNNDVFTCNVATGSTTSYYPVTNVTLPFTLPLAFPFKF